ncbi:hypothetical protein [Streptomyces sp. NPDC001927]
MAEHPGLCPLRAKKTEASVAVAAVIPMMATPIVQEMKNPRSRTGTSMITVPTPASRRTRFQLAFRHVRVLWEYPSRGTCEVVPQASVLITIAPDGALLSLEDTSIGYRIDFEFKLFRRGTVKSGREPS